MGIQNGLTESVAFNRNSLLFSFGAKQFYGGVHKPKPLDLTETVYYFLLEQSNSMGVCINRNRCI